MDSVSIENPYVSQFILTKLPTFRGFDKMNWNSSTINENLTIIPTPHPFSGGFSSNREFNRFLDLKNSCFRLDTRKTIMENHTRLEKMWKPPRIGDAIVWVL